MRHLSVIARAAGLKELAGLENLRSLSLYDNKKVTVQGLKQLASFKNLEELQLEGTKVTDADLKDLASRVLDVPDWSLCKEEIKATQFLPVERVARYCAKDCRYTLELFWRQQVCLDSATS